MTKEIDGLNEVYSIHQPISYQSKFWDKFEKQVIKIKSKGIAFKHLNFDKLLYDDFKRSGKGKKVSRATIHAIGNIEALSYMIEKCEESYPKDTFFSTSESKKYIKYYLLELKRERDFSFADLLDEKYFKALNTKTIQFASCVNQIIDYKIKNIIKKSK